MNRKLFGFGKKKSTSVSNLNLDLHAQDEARCLDPFLKTNDDYMEILKRQRFENIDPVIEATTDYQKALSFLEIAEYYPYENVVRRVLYAIDRVIARGSSCYASDELEIAESSRIRLVELLQLCLSKENSRASSATGFRADEQDLELQDNIAAQQANGLPHTNEGIQTNQGSPGKTPEARNQIKQERPRSRLSTLNLAGMDRRIDNEAPKTMASTPW